MFETLRSALLLFLLVVSGCAYAEVRPVKNDTEEGIRFYRPWPYVWVNLAKEGGGCEMTVQWLPDMSKEYIIIPHTGMGSLQVNPTLAEGWNLTSLNIVADSKASEMVTAIAGMTGTIAGAAITPFNRANVLGPGLYRLKYTGASGRFDGLDEVFHLEENGQPLRCVKR